MQFTVSITKLSNEQWVKVTKALFYSFFSGFFAGLLLAAGNFISAGGTLDHKAITALVIAGVVAGINTLIVGVKQVFTPAVATVVEKIVTTVEKKVIPVDELPGNTDPIDAPVPAPVSTTTASVGLPDSAPIPDQAVPLDDFNRPIPPPANG